MGDQYLIQKCSELGIVVGGTNERVLRMFEIIDILTVHTKILSSFVECFSNSFKMGEYFVDLCTQTLASGPLRLHSYQIRQQRFVHA